MAKKVIRGRVRTLTATIRDLKTGDPIDLTGADPIQVCFKTDADESEKLKLSTGIDEVQTITFSATPDAGSFKLSHEGNLTSALLFSDSAATIEAALNALSSLSAVTVSGSFAAGFVVTFAGADGKKEQPLLLVPTGDNTLTESSNAVTVSIVETTKGFREAVTLVGDAVLGKISIDMLEVDTAKLETGDGKGFDIEWTIGGKVAAAAVTNVLNVTDPKCP